MQIHQTLLGVLQINSRSLRLGENRRKEVTQELTDSAPLMIQVMVKITPFLSPPVHIARLAHMRRSLSICQSVCLSHLIKIDISENTVPRILKLYHSIKPL